MTTLTFESISNSPRRAAIRRTVRPAPRVFVPEQTVVPLLRKSSDIISGRNKAGLFALVGLAVIIHAGVITAVHQAGPIEAAKPKLVPLTIDIAPPPPPPPPPEIKPKPLPQVAKPIPAPRPLPPSVPVVSQTPVDNAPSADAVRVATAAPPAPVAAPEPVTEPRGFAGYLNNPAPVYPDQAQDQGLQGRVILKVHVLASGRPDSVTVGKTSGHKILDDAAIKAVLAWAFEPAKRGQTPVDGWVNVPLNFKLS